MRLPSSPNTFVIGVVFCLCLFAVVNIFFNLRSVDATEDPQSASIPILLSAQDRSAASVPADADSPADYGATTNVDENITKSSIGAIEDDRAGEEKEKVSIAGEKRNRNSRPPRQSFHMCHSRDESRDNFRVASCRFKNMCLVYDLEGNQAVSWIYVESTEALKVYGKNSVRAETLSFSLGIGPHQVDKRLLVEPKRMGAEAFALKYPKVDWQRGKSVVFHEYNFENFGHAIADQLMPIFFLQRSFGTVSRDMHLYEFTPWRPVGTTCAWQLKKRGPKYVVTCPKFRKVLLPVVTQYPVQHLNKRLNETKIPLCFEDLMGGMQMYSDDCLEGSHGRKTKVHSECNHGKQPGFLEFRKFMLDSLGVDDTPPVEHQVVIWNANYKRRVRGLEEYAGILKRALNVTAVSVDWSKMPVKDQLQYMANSTVYITIPGGGSQVSLFLPRGATAIRLFRYEFLLDFHFYRYMSHITNIEFEVDSTMKPSLLIDTVRTAMQRYDAFRQRL